ncbi:MAG TPA: amidohydrolase family protein [Candidatus Dormibacteraeota bacterium]|nr:amidohydrolase family protein [Candidatus Dormibacteraeota bacterium]
MIDAQAHVFRRLSPRYPRQVSELYPPGRQATAEELLTAMDGAGVERAVLTALSPEDEYLAECLRRHPDRFAGVSVLDARRPDAAEALARKAEVVGVSGIRMHWLAEPDRDPEETPAFSLLADMTERGLVLCLYAPASQLAVLAALLDRLAGLTVVLGQLGFPLLPTAADRLGRPRVEAPLPPPTLPAVLELARHPAVHVLFAGQPTFSRRPYPYPDLDLMAGRLYHEYGPRRLLWASDFPWTRTEPGYARTVELVDHQLPGLPQAERAAILGGTAARLFTAT